METMIEQKLISETASQLIGYGVYTVFTFLFVVGGRIAYLELKRKFDNHEN